MKKLLVAYTGIGLLAFVVSFIFEIIMLFSFTGSVLLSLTLTLVLEASKLLLTVVHRFVEDRDYHISDNVRSMSSFFRFGLVFISVLCTLTYFSSSLDRPNMENIRAEDTKRVESAFNEKIELINAQRQERMDTIKNEVHRRYRARYQELDALYLPKIAELESKRTKEFDRVINGVRKGPYWNEYDRQLQGLKGAYQREKQGLRIAEDEDLANIPEIEGAFQKKLDTALNDKEAALAHISTNDYQLDDRVKNQDIASLLATLDQGLGIKISYLAFGILLSTLTSLLLELAIYLAFNYIVSLHNVLNPIPKDGLPEYEFEDPPEVEPEVVYADDEPVAGRVYGPAGQGVSEPEIDPETFDFLQHLNHHFGSPGDKDPEDPCGQ